MNDIKRMKYLRMNIISELLSEGDYSFRELREEVMSRLDLATYSLSTVCKDRDAVFEEWYAERIKRRDHHVQLELRRIKKLMEEAWEAWYKSKRERTKRTGMPSDDAESSGGIATVKVEQTSETQSNCGDPRFLDIINKLQQERRKLLGLYSPDKKEVSGRLSFTDLLMQTGIVEDGTPQ